MATGKGNLPNPNMAFTPFDILLAEELNDLVENIESLATGAGIGDGSIGTSDLADASVTAAKIALGGILGIRNDTSNLSSLVGAKIQAGWGQFLGNGTSSQNVSVSFPSAFTTAPYMVIIKLNGYKTSGTFTTLKDINNGIGPQFEGSTSAITNNGFTANFNGTSNFGAAYHAFSWIAIGI